jgi:hypothetical protein
MTDDRDLDLDLRDRLSLLAAAVPVESPGSVAPVRARIRSGATGQRLVLSGLLPVVAVVLIGTVLVALAQVGPLSPGVNNTNGPVVATTTDGPFELTIRSTKARYAPSEPIDIDASLTYLGGDEALIRHAQGASMPGINAQRPGGPIGFGTREPVVGDLRLSPSWRESCEQTNLPGGQPLTIPFEKSAAWSGDDPRSQDYSQYLRDPVLRLQAGTWNVYAVAEFVRAECGFPADPDVNISFRKVSLEATIEIEVLAGDPSATTARADPSDGVPSLEPTPAQTPRLDPTHGVIQPDGSVVDEASDGSFDLRLRAERSVYLESEPIDIAAELRFQGVEQPSVDLSGSTLVGFGLRQLDGTLGMGWGSAATCAPLGSMSSGSDTQVRVIPFAKSVAFSEEDPNREYWEAYMADPELRLPEGTWQIIATTLFRLGKACEVAGPQLTTSVTVKVVSPAGEAIELWTAAAPATGCRLAMGGGILALHPESGLGVLAVLDAPAVAVTWPFGYTARWEAAGAVLLDPTGMLVARVGDHVRFTGGANDGSFYVCTGVHAVDESSTP